MPDESTAPAARRLSQEAVEAAIRALAHTSLKTQTDSMLRTFLAFKAVSADGAHDTQTLRDVVVEHFTVLATPPGLNDTDLTGTLKLRGSGGSPSWMKNDSYRGAFLDYAGPTSPGRKMFKDEDWREPFIADAVQVVVDTLGSPQAYGWPARDALAALALRNTPLPASLTWQDIAERARERFNLTDAEWAKITSGPVLSVGPFDGDPWDPARLSDDLRPPGSEKAEKAQQSLHGQPPELAAAIERVVGALEKHGHRSIIALAGVPGTGKSHIARLAARLYASDGCLREIQFSPGYTYEEFIEGPRFSDGLKVKPEAGAFLELNGRALAEPGSQFVLLIEELSRADLPKVLGELLTYVEYRSEDDTFTTMYSRDKESRVAPNLAILATYNPTDRSAVSIDSALIRRLRIVSFPPDTALLREILIANGVDQKVIDQLVTMFDKCRGVAGADRFDDAMPFGHAVFSTVESEKDLYELWHQELKPLMIRPRTPPHELFDTIRDHYPWHASADVSLFTGASAEQAGEDDGLAAETASEPDEAPAAG